MEERSGSTKATRRAARETLPYHEARLAELLEHVRNGFARYDAGELDAFELDDLIHHYKRATQKLWSFCVVSGGHVEQTVRALEWQAREGETTDWGELGASRRR